MLRQEYEERLEGERGLVGLVARFIRIPADVRDAAGLSGAGNLAALVVGFVVQILIAVAAPLLVAYLIYRLGWTPTTS